MQNPQILLAQQRIAEARALRLGAIAQLLPTLNTGTNIDVHNGPLQQSNGTILNVNRSALYGGLGANAIAAGSVNIPGIVFAGNVSEGIFGALARAGWCAPARPAPLPCAIASCWTLPAPTSACCGPKATGPSS